MNPYEKIILDKQKAVEEALAQEKREQQRRDELEEKQLNDAKDLLKTHCLPELELAKKGLASAGIKAQISMKQIIDAELFGTKKNSLVLEIESATVEIEFQLNSSIKTSVNFHIRYPHGESNRSWNEDSSKDLRLFTAESLQGALKEHL